MEAVFYFSFAAMVAIPLTATICRWRIARGKRISVGTILTGASSAALLSIFWIPFFDAGTTTFTHEYWAHLKIGSGIPFYLFSFFGALRVSPAFCQLAELSFIIRREKRNNLTFTKTKRRPRGRFCHFVRNFLRRAFVKRRRCDRQ